MERPVELKKMLRPDAEDFSEYETCVKELLNNDSVRSMERFIQHGNVSCLEHCVFVSYRSFEVCKRLGLDFRSAARGGLLHDMFLYDWHIKDPSRKNHAFGHAGVALANAGSCFSLNDIEKDIIGKHMWPLTVKLPKYMETFVVTFVDKFCTACEVEKVRPFRELAGRIFKQKS